MKTTEIHKMQIAAKQAPYNDVQKAEFRRLAMKALRELKILLGHATADIRYNPGGIAVCGEATLHSSSIYVQISGTDLGVLYRTVKHNRDYTGGPNNWFSNSRFEEYGVKGLAAAVQQLLSYSNSEAVL